MSAFRAAKTAEGATADLAAISALLARFAFAAQTVTDAGDPSNYASLVVASQTPVLLSEVVGDLAEGGVNVADQVIPNQTENTKRRYKPLIRALQLPSVTTATLGEVVDGVPSGFWCGSLQSRAPRVYHHYRFVRVQRTQRTTREQLKKCNSNLSVTCLTVQQFQ